MTRRVLLGLFLVAALCFAAAPKPNEVLGFTPGDDYKLANYSDIIGYFKKLAASSDRIKLAEFGKTSNGRPMYIAFISSPENLRNLNHYRDISRRLALGLPTPAEARLLAAEGKAIVWIDSGLHASEVAPAQHSPELAYRMVTEETEEVRRIRQNVILLQVPVINPDGLDMIAEWYRKNVGTPYELARMPWLYQKYCGHDNNRDWFMMNLQETRNVSRLLFQEWFPQIVYNQHQAPSFPARIFIPPYAEPLNPNIPAPVMAGINQIGAVMSERFARENKTGVLSYTQFDGWWNGGLRSVPAFHNMHGILTETALYDYATPHVYKPESLPAHFRNGIPTRQSTIFYPMPWLGGRWGLRDAVDYMLTADFAILNLAASDRSRYLTKAYDMAKAGVAAGQKGGPFAYLIPTDQWDRSSTLEFLRRLKLGGVEIRRASANFTAGGKAYTEGTYMLPAAQPFRAYLMDLVEPQKFPEIRTGGKEGTVKKPYDIAGWTLSLQMGVKVERIDEPFESRTSVVGEVPALAPTLDHRENASFLTTADLLARGETVRWAADGAILTAQSASSDAFAKAAYQLKSPRVALYQPWMANADAGWTEWLLDNYKIPHKLLHNDELKNSDLSASFDTIILAQQSLTSLTNGNRSTPPPASGADSSASSTTRRQRPEYTGGIGPEGIAKLESFVRNGGTLITFDAASELAVKHFQLSLQSLLRASAESADNSDEEDAGPFKCPGSLLRISVDNSQPLAFGMPKEAIAFSTGGQAFEFQDTDQLRAVARYASANLLASGWISGEKIVLGKTAMAEARHGSGRVILFGFRPQYRGQSFNTFKLVLNAIYLGSAQQLKAQPVAAVTSGRGREAGSRF